MKDDFKPHEALILAGGLGRRLRAAVSEVPKPMAPVGERPFLEFLLDYWLEQGITRFVLSVGYLAEHIENHFGSIYKGAAVEYVREKEPLGTGGALAMALREINWQGRRILSLNGDTWLTVSLPLLTAESEKGLPVVLALTEVAVNDRYGRVTLDQQGRVESFGGPADGSPALINAGCYILDTAALIKITTDYPSRFSLENDLLAPLAERGLVGASIQAADFIDIGVVEDYSRFCRQKSNAD